MTLSQWINPQYLPFQGELNSNFMKALPFPHLELTNFFIQEKVIQLVQALAEERFEPKTADLFQLKQTHDIISSSNFHLQQFRNFLISAEFREYLNSVTMKKLQPTKVDLSGSLYEDTDFLLCHDDQLEKRSIAFFLYLSTMEKEDGGRLFLYDSEKREPTTVKTIITPKFNTFAFFEVSAKSFHAVEEVISKTQRIALSGWFHAHH